MQWLEEARAENDGSRRLEGRAERDSGICGPKTVLTPTLRMPTVPLLSNVLKEQHLYRQYTDTLDCHRYAERWLTQATGPLGNACDRTEGQNL